VRRPPGLDMLDRARRLRREMTPQERLLWSHLRDRRLAGAKFRKQMWLTGYIADFACPEARLVVEADGSQHAEDQEYDTRRERAFAALGWRTLRFWNNEILENLDGVLTTIANGLPSPSQPAAPAGPLPLPSRERGQKSAAPQKTPLPPGEREGPAAKRWEGEGTPVGEGK
jgi:very-short-patch-repair endonuclease